MKVGIIVFPGSNCDRDMHHVLHDVFNLDVQYIWHTKSLPPDVDAIILPGGFSYGDRLRAGAIAAHSPVMADVKRLASQHMPILGVCNGFQILTESEILPGALIVNESLDFMCQWTNLIVKNTHTPFTSNLKIEQTIPIPIANGEGRYYIDEDTLCDMKKHDQIVFKYADEINGSTDMIAGVCNKEQNVIGMMPHPERAAEYDTNPVDCKPVRQIFESLIKSVADVTIASTDLTTKKGGMITH